MKSKNRKGAKIAVIGAGAVGSVTAGFIAKAGYDVELVCKYRELANKIRSGNLHITGVKGNFRVGMPAVEKIRDLSEPKDIIILATKATDMQDAAKALVPFLYPRSIIVSMQNGICTEPLLNILTQEQIINCIISWGATMHLPGEVEMTGTGKFTIGNARNSANQCMKDLQKILGSVVPTVISKNIAGDLYVKLIINSCINSIGAICGLNLGRMLSHKKIRNLFIEITYEAIKVADAMGVRINSFGNVLTYERFSKGTGLFDNFIRHLSIRIFGIKFGRITSSSLQSLKRGKPTEIDYLNGYISRQGKAYKVPTPINDKVIEIVKDIESGRKEIGIGNFNDPFFKDFESYLSYQGVWKKRQRRK